MRGQVSFLVTCENSKKHPLEGLFIFCLFLLWHPNSCHSTLPQIIASIAIYRTES